MTPNPAGSAAGRPRPIAELARSLDTNRATLWRALHADPEAPAPADRDDQGRPLYDRDQVTAWWPNRRGRGRPKTHMPEERHV